MAEWASSLPLSANVIKRKPPYRDTLHLEGGVPALGGDAVPLAERQAFFSGWNHCWLNFWDRRWIYPGIRQHI